MENVMRIEKQLEFRDHQIKELTRKCSLLQIELEQLNENPDLNKRSLIPKEDEFPAADEIAMNRKQKHIHWEDEEAKEETKKVQEMFEEEIVDVEEIEELENIDEEEETKKELAEKDELKVARRHKLTTELESKAELVSSLYHEVGRLRHVSNPIKY